VDLGKQLLPGTFEWTADHVIEKLDLSGFDMAYNNDENGAKAYPPAVLLKILLYCYSRGMNSSRRIEAACVENIVVKALAADAEPDHATIAHFISSNAERFGEVFSQVTLYCGELGLIGGDMFAIDGCKLPSNASKELSGTLEEFEKKKADLEKLGKKLAKQHRERDRKENRKLNKTCREFIEKKEYHQRHMERIEQKIAKLEGFLETAEPRQGSGGSEVQSNITDNESAKIKGAHGYIQGYNGIAVADSARQVIVAADAIGSGSESGIFPEMLDKLETAMQEATGRERPLSDALVAGDTGYYSEANLSEAAKRKIEVIIPDPQFRKRDPQFAGRKGHGERQHYTAKEFKHDAEENTYECPAGKKLRHKGHIELNRNSGEKYQAKSSDCKGCGQRERCVTSRGGRGDAPRTLYVADRGAEQTQSDMMREKIDDPVCRALYGRRMQIIEPVFADITRNKKLDRFTLRGRIKVRAQWLLYCVAHNIGKCRGAVEALGAL
jgi:transposase